MSSLDWWDQIEEYQKTQTDLPPLWTVAKKKEDEILKWASNVTQALKEVRVQRNHEMRSNLALYKGGQYHYRTTKSVSSRTTLDGLPTTSMPRLKVNHLYEITEQLVSKATRFKPAVEALPTNDEYEDKITAENVTRLIKHLWYINDIDEITRQAKRQSIIFGESFLFITWDPKCGDTHPAWEAGLDLLDENGETVKDAEGNPVKIEKAPKIGDVKYELEVPYRVLVQPKHHWNDVEYVIRVHIKNIHDMVADYPKQAEQLKQLKNKKSYDSGSMMDQMKRDEIVVYELFHKNTDKLPKGKRILFTDDVILEIEDNPYSHGGLPCERLTDIDIPDVLHGVSLYDIVRPIQLAHDSLSSMILKNQYLAAHPKWVMPKGACKIDSLGNDITIVQYKGGVPPQLVQSNPTPQEVFLYREKLKEELEQISGVFGTSRGAPPAGITASVAMQFLNEQESERSNSSNAKWGSFIRNIASKTISVAGDYYRPDDGRMLRILGKDNRYDIRHFDAADLAKSYDIRIQNSSALPDSKAARIQTIIDLKGTFPNLWSDEQVLDLLDFGQSDKMADMVTEALRAAESENEDILSGRPVSEPKEWEDHILHWRTHVRKLQSRQFKEEVPPELQEALITHISMTEFLMIEKMQENPLFEAKLAQLDTFPLFYKPGQPPRSREDQIARVQGAANRGEPDDSVIPAEEPIAFPGERARNTNQGEE